MLCLQVVAVDKVDYPSYCGTLINELEAAGLQIPAKVDPTLYRK